VGLLSVFWVSLGLPWDFSTFGIQWRLRTGVSGGIRLGFHSNEQEYNWRLGTRSLGWTGLELVVMFYLSGTKHKHPKCLLEFEGSVFGWDGIDYRWLLLSHPLVLP